jgi:hypothetical protein
MGGRHGVFDACARARAEAAVHTRFTRRASKGVVGRVFERIAEAEAQAIIPSTRSRKVQMPHGKVATSSETASSASLKLAHFRRIATRYDRRAIHFMGHPACQLNHLDEMNVDPALESQLCTGENESENS